MRRTLAIIKTAVTLILAIIGIVFVVGLSSPESRWSGPSLAVMGFCLLFIALTTRVLVQAFRKPRDGSQEIPPGP